MNKSIISLALLSLVSFNGVASDFDWEKKSKATLKTTVESICGIQVRTQDDSLEVSGGKAKVEFYTLNNKSNETTIKFGVKSDLAMNVGNADPLTLIDVDMKGSYSELKRIRTLADLNNEELNFDRRDFGLDQDGNVHGVVMDLTLNAEHEQLMSGNNIKTVITANVDCK